MIHVDCVIYKVLHTKKKRIYITLISIVVLNTRVDDFKNILFELWSGFFGH